MPAPKSKQLPTAAEVAAEEAKSRKVTCPVCLGPDEERIWIESLRLAGMSYPAIIRACERHLHKTFSKWVLQNHATLHEAAAA